MDLDKATVRVGRVGIEVAGHVTYKLYPKSRAGRRTVPPPPFVVKLLRQHKRIVSVGASGRSLPTGTGGPMRRTVFRAWIWRPALVRAGLLGQVAEVGAEALARDLAGPERRRGQQGVSQPAYGPRAGLADGAGRSTLHDLRYSYATWLISGGVPINDVARVMGHEQISTTLDRYTHAFEAGAGRVRDSLADFPLTVEGEEDETPPIQDQTTSLRGTAETA